MKGTPFHHRIAGAAVVLVAIGLPGPWGGDVIPAARSELQDRLPGDPETGRRLFRRFDCVRCHSAARGGRGTNIPPSLELAGSRAQTSWMIEFLLDPQPLRFESEGKRPDLRMPRIPMTRGDAADLASFLAVQRDDALVSPHGPAIEHDDTLVARGAALFEEYQCRGCHEVAGRGRQVGPALDGVGGRRQPGYVRALLLDPSGVIPQTAMKDFQLWDEEAAALGAFLAGME